MDTPIGIKQLNKARQVNVTVEHDITQTPNGKGRWVAECRTHDTTALTDHTTPDDARTAFICDGGTKLRFIAALRAPNLDQDTAWLDLPGLRELLEDLDHAVTHGYGTPSDVTVWQWIGDGQTAPVTIRRTTDRKTWIAEDATGAELVRF